MRILVVSNFYPPHGLGGQEQSCYEVVEELRHRGHQVSVLTSTHGVNGTEGTDDGVQRLLHLEMDLAPLRNAFSTLLYGARRETHNLECFRRVYEALLPDIVFVWGMWNLPRSLPAFIEASAPGRVVFRFADYWPTLPSQQESYWRAPARHPLFHLPKRLLGAVCLSRLPRGNQRQSLALEHVICVSQATRQALVAAGIPVSHARVIPNGLDASRFVERSPAKTCREGRIGLRLLYAGRLAPEKGVDTAIEAISRLSADGRCDGIQLSVVGAGSPRYETALRALVASRHLGRYVQFLGAIPPVEMPRIMSQFDVLVFPPRWAEPFGRVVVEAMLSGVVVLAARSGGVGEIIEDGRTGLFFRAGDAEELAERVLQLRQHPELRRTLAKAAREVAVRNFSLAATVDRIERYLEEVRNTASRGMALARS